MLATTARGNRDLARRARAIALVSSLVMLAALTPRTAPSAISPAIQAVSATSATGHTAHEWGYIIDDRPDAEHRVGSLTPDQVGMDTGWSSTAAGFDHTVAIRTDGSMWAWGYNFYGQLGDGTTTDHFEPVRIGTDTDWASVTAGYEVTLAVKADGTLWSWGMNYDGLLGNGTSYQQLSGTHTPTQVGTDADWESVALGYNHATAIKSDGTLWTWGSNPVGELGDGTSTSRWAPAQVGTDSDWTAAAAGANHTMAIKSDGTLWAWGFNLFGQLGDGTTTSRSTPAQVGADSDWSSVTGWQDTVAIKTDGTLWGWGRNDYGQVGDGTTTHRSGPVQVGTDTDWASTASGGSHTLALKTDGTVWAWGNNYVAQLGNGSTGFGTSTPTQVGSDTGWAAVSAYNYHSVALRLAPETDPATVTITSPAADASYLQGQVVTADYSCDDPSGVTTCLGDVPVGSPIDTATAGDHAFQVSTLDGAGNAGSETVHYTVLAGSAEATLSGAGGVVTTDPGNLGASPAVPVQTVVTAPVGVSGVISVTPQDTATASPAGLVLFGTEVVLTGPVATPASPYQVSFTVDGSTLDGVAPADVQVLRNGVALTGCTAPVAAVPDPCIVSRGFAPGGGGDAVVSVRTSHFSTWSLGRPDYTLTGPFQPVDAAPAVNKAKAGSAIPVKFKLGGYRGLDVLAAGYPKTTSTGCAGATSDEIEQTLDGSTTLLSYDAASGQYTYKWKTTGAMKGCRDLVLKFRDGTQLRALFSLR